jgi:dephospho-CoA kinase
MLKVGITGGIGSGKTTVCGLFEVLGIPVFYADDAARALMDEDVALKAAIGALFGNHIYHAGRLDRAAVSAAVFGNPEKLTALNALVHPASVAAAERWLLQQHTPYAVKEAAIFFESGTHTGMNVMIGVSAPVEVRIARAIARSGLTRAEVLARIARQMDDAEKMRRCDYVINNDGAAAVLPQVLSLHEKMLERSKKSDAEFPTER